MFPLSSAFMSTQAELLSEIETFLAVRKMAATTFGRLAVNDGKFVPRLRSGCNMTLATVERVRCYLHSQKSDVSQDDA
jgi:hypothetical protein